MHLYKSMCPSVGLSVGPKPVFLSQQKCGKVAKYDYLHTFNVSLSIVQSESVFQYPFHNLSFTIFLSQSFFHELSFTIIFPKSSAAICQLQAFFYDPSSTIFLCNLFLLISTKPQTHHCPFAGLFFV